jgi:anti-anti-sigma regulatory factor
MLRIEVNSNGLARVLRLSGRLSPEHIQLLTSEMGDVKSSVTLDLRDVTFIDPGIITFLMRNERDGVTLLNCSMFVREMIERERQC